MWLFKRDVCEWNTKKYNRGFLYMDVVMGTFVMAIGLIGLFGLTASTIGHLRMIYIMDRILQKTVVYMETAKAKSYQHKPIDEGILIDGSYRYEMESQPQVVQEVPVLLYHVKGYYDDKELYSVETYLRQQ